MEEKRMVKKSSKKKQKNMLMYILAIIAIIVVLLLVLYTQTDVFSGSVLDYKNRPFGSDPDTNSNSDNNGGSSDFDDEGPSDDSNEDEEQVQKSWTGGGVITGDVPCITYIVDEEFDTPRLLFSYSATWDDEDECCYDCDVRWTIYEGTKFLKTITQTNPGSGQTYITNYNGGNLKICVEQTCELCCVIVVSYTLQILD